MAKGREEHEARVAARNAFGKDLARRARSKCELCGRGGERLAVFEVPPIPREPDFGRCLLLCDDCLGPAEDTRRLRSGEHWRFLAAQAWSDNVMVQVLAVRLLRRLSGSQDWAREALDGLYLDEEVEALVTEGE
jgi:protein PhnA